MKERLAPPVSFNEAEETVAVYRNNNNNHSLVAIIFMLSSWEGSQRSIESAGGLLFYFGSFLGRRIILNFSWNRDSLVVFNWLQKSLFKQIVLAVPNHPRLQKPFLELAFLILYFLRLLTFYCQHKWIVRKVKRKVFNWFHKVTNFWCFEAKKCWCMVYETSFFLFGTDQSCVWCSFIFRVFNYI